MTEQELREKIAREICRQSTTSLYSIWYENPANSNLNDVWFRRADQILALIKETLPERANPLILELKDIKSMGHFGVVRDWIIELKNGRVIELGADIVKQILEREAKEAGYNSKEKTLEIAVNCVEQERKLEREVMINAGYVKLADVVKAVERKTRRMNNNMSGISLSRDDWEAVISELLKRAGGE